MTRTRMTFTKLLAEITATYQKESRRFHVLATRYYLGKETRDSLTPYLNYQQINAIINNR